MNSSSCGTLYIISTPIGNLKDLSERAIETMRTVDLILAEDTRQTKKLLYHFQIEAPLQSFHDHSSSGKMQAIISQIKEGKSMALVSDSGTPLLSDPGFPLTREAVKNDIPIVAIPGASALLTALVASGAPMERFIFEGFIPPKGSSRRERLEKIKHEESTQIIYESPYHILKLLEDLRGILGEKRNIVIGRELTKIHEEYLRGSIADLIMHFQKVKPRGEFVVIVPKKDKETLQEQFESSSEI